MERENVIAVMKEIYTTSEAAEYLNISKQRLNQLVHDHQIEPVKASKSVLLFWKKDLDQRKVANITNEINKGGTFEINNTFVRDAILYYTIQQYFNNNDKRTGEFIGLVEKGYDFNFHAGLKNNIPFLAKQLQVSEKEFYEKYLFVKSTFLSLPKDVILVKKGDLNYSRLLELTKEAPPYLFCRGDLNLLKEKSICVVGSRNASQEAMAKTKQLVQEFVNKNLVVTAGLARGIDTATHTAALENHGKTIAVIGTPINQYYPKENKALQMEIEKKGLVVSQFPPCNKVQRWNFPTRNGVMSGLSIATIIMEAGETSGALKQADYALKQGRDVLIPLSAINNPMLKWPKKYVQRGAYSFETLIGVVEILNNNKLLHNVFKECEVSEINNVEMDF